MRIERSFIALLMILIPVAFTSRITIEIFFLMSLCVILYAIGALYNAEIDNDYELHDTRKVLVIFTLGGLILALTHLILLITYLSWFILAFIYSKYSRSILFGDSTILAITHATIPILSSSVLSGLDVKSTIILTIFMSLSLWLVIPMKNLNGIEKDKELGYSTLITKLFNGRRITFFLFELYFISIMLAYFVLSLNHIFLSFVIIIFILKIIIFDNINNGNEVLGYKLSKLVTLLFSLGIIVSVNSRLIILLIPILLIFIYTIYLSLDIKFTFFGVGEEA